MRKLVERGFAQQHRGAQGGYSLAMDAKDISLFDIIDTMETSMKINMCLEEDGYCSRKATPTCTVHNIYIYIQEQLETTLSSVSFVDILEGNIPFLESIRGNLKGV